MATSHETWLAGLLRLAGGTCCLAVIPSLMPRSWIMSTHVFLGLGPFPEEPIAEYLARFSSALCVFYGGLLIVLSFDVRRSSRVITYQAIAIMIFSSLGVYWGQAAGIPLVWVASDAVACWCYCVPTLWLQRKMATTHP